VEASAALTAANPHVDREDTWRFRPGLSPRNPTVTVSIIDERIVADCLKLFLQQHLDPTHRAVDRGDTVAMKLGSVRASKKRLISV
jgi:hypothetical protein